MFLDTPPSLNSSKATLLLLDLFLLPHSILFAQKILQLKTTDPEPTALITFHMYAFHKTKSTALLKDYIVHFLQKIFSPTIHNVTFLQTK